MTSTDPRYLFLEYRAELLIYLSHRLGDAEQAEELVQEMYIRFCQSPSLGGIENVRAYLFGMARHIIADTISARSRSRTESISDMELDEYASPYPGPDANAAARQMLEHLAAALDDLPELTRQIFTLNRLYQYSHQEVGDRLGVSSSTVQKHLARALAHVAAQMREH
ncbi:RNA polymerase sigma-70 factor (ECF subfamily) [Corticibacter populi]|nr:RNA polymerase sigma-70 factor (ECF subfamily) [Corticibacter populi]